MSNLKRLSLLSVAVGALVTTTAVAQTENYYSRDKYEAVRDRPQPEFDPEPVRLGAFLVRPQADLGVTSSDNILASSSNAQSDVIARIGGSVSATSNWSVHEIGGDASAHRNQYLDNDRESFDELTALARGRLDVSREFALAGAAFAQDLSEPRTSFVNDFGVDRPVQFTRTGFSVEANYQNDRVRWNNSVGITDENYKDGRQVNTGFNIDQDYRDRKTTNARTRLAYAVSPNLAVFGQGTASKSEYDQTQVLGGLPRSRDSQGYTVSGGVDFELNSLFRGDVAVGYLNEKKDDAFFADVSGLSLDGRVQWFPTRLTTVAVNAGRRVVDVGAFDSPSALETIAGVRVDHELRRNIILSGFANAGTYDYEETDRKDENIEFGAIATYKMNKRVHFEAFARRLDRDTSGNGVFGDPSFGVTLIGIGLRLHP